MGVEVEHMSDTSNTAVKCELTINTRDTVTNRWEMMRKHCLNNSQLVCSLKTRPVSWTSPPSEVPAILDSRMDDTSAAAAENLGMSDWTE
jgi:hypothetical protein